MNLCYVIRGNIDQQDWMTRHGKHRVMVIVYFEFGNVDTVRVVNHDKVKSVDGFCFK